MLLKFISSDYVPGYQATEGGSFTRPGNHSNNIITNQSGWAHFMKYYLVLGMVRVCVGYSEQTLLPTLGSNELAVRFQRNYIIAFNK